MFHAGIWRLIRLALCVFLAIQSAACGVPRGGWTVAGGGTPETTYRKFLARAEAGEAESQNLVGFMLFHGEGVRSDRTRARMWFERAAAQGNPRAQRNLASMHALGAPETGVVPGQMLTGTRPQISQAGQTRYEMFCAGCHGFNGISFYVHSPSFALGETLEKGDAELMHSLLHGKGEMPNWDDKFSPGDLLNVLQYVRTLRAKYDLGIGQALSGPPPVYYLFGPMRSDQPAYRELLRDYAFEPPRTGP